MPYPQIREGCALIDAEQHLTRIDGVRKAVQTVVLRLAPLQPAQSPLAAGFCVFIGRRILNTFIKRHGNVAAQIGLNPRGFLRPHENLMAVDVRGEINALLLDFPQTGEGKYLEAAGVRQDGAVPVDEFVKPAQLADNPVAGAQMKVIGIAQFNLTAHLLQVMSGNAAFDGALCADIHEYRRLDHTAVGAGKFAASGTALSLNYSKHSIFSLFICIWRSAEPKSPPGVFS